MGCSRLGNKKIYAHNYIDPSIPWPHHPSNQGHYMPHKVKFYKCQMAHKGTREIKNAKQLQMSYQDIGSHNYASRQTMQFACTSTNITSIKLYEQGTHSIISHWPQQTTHGFTNRWVWGLEVSDNYLRPICHQKGIRRSELRKWHWGVNFIDT